MNNNIILIGMPGSGKSTVGVVLAKVLGMDFLDADLVIQKNRGKRLQRLLDEYGIERFLEMEAEDICTIDCNNTVIAPGGSAVLKENGAEHLKSLGRLVYIKISPERLGKRLANLKTRGVAMKKGETIKDVYDYRAPFYEKYADIVVDAGATLEETVDNIIKSLNEIKTGA